MNMGRRFFAAQGPTDVVTVVYTDSTFYLNCYRDRRRSEDW